MTSKSQYKRLVAQGAIEPRTVAWICAECATLSGAEHMPNHVATFHEDTCGVCKKTKTVTEPRDFRWVKHAQIGQEDAQKGED
jgi:hypothetical protein